MKHLSFLLPVIACCTALAPDTAIAAPLADVLDRPALQASHPEHGVFLKIARAGDRLVAVGERGRIVYSDDNGNSWQQADVPVSVTLTNLTFPNATHGWAVGHSGVVLHSKDAGKSWQKQLDGAQAAQITFETTQRRTEDRYLRRSARYLLEDGPDKPFLDLSFKDQEHGIIVGAYGLIMRTDDGGKNWTSWLDRVPNRRGMHIYAIHQDGDHIYLAGEQGLFVRSTDNGISFQRIEMPYDGSFFALTKTQNGALAVAGLRGNLLWSTDNGANFVETETHIPVSIEHATTLADGRLLFVNHAGTVLSGTVPGHPPTPILASKGPPITSVIEAADGSLIGTSFHGLSRLSYEHIGGPQ